MGEGSLAFEMISHIPCWLARICCICSCFQLCFGSFFVQSEIPFTVAALRVVCIQLSACPVVLMFDTTAKQRFLPSISTPYKKQNNIKPATLDMSFSLALLHPIPASKRACSEMT